MVCTNFYNIILMLRLAIWWLILFIFIHLRVLNKLSFFRTIFGNANLLRRNISITFQIHESNSLLTLFPFLIRKNEFYFPLSKIIFCLKKKKRKISLFPKKCVAVFFAIFAICKPKKTFLRSILTLRFYFPLPAFVFFYFLCLVTLAKPFFLLLNLLM